MKCICTHACICRGVHTLPDTVLDLSEDELKQDHIKASFAPCASEVTAPAAEENQTDSGGMSKATYRQLLDKLGIPYAPTDTLEDLGKLYRKATSTQSRKAIK